MLELILLLTWNCRNFQRWNTGTPPDPYLEFLLFLTGKLCEFEECWKLSSSLLGTVGISRDGMLEFLLFLTWNCINFQRYCRTLEDWNSPCSLALFLLHLQNGAQSTHCFSLAVPIGNSYCKPTSGTLAL